MIYDVYGRESGETFAASTLSDFEYDLEDDIASSSPSNDTEPTWYDDIDSDAAESGADIAGAIGLPSVDVAKFVAALTEGTDTGALAAAAEAAIRHYYEDTTSSHKEYGGALYCNLAGTSCGYTESTDSGRHWSYVWPNRGDLNFPRGDQLAGYWHIHPDNPEYDSEHFSTFRNDARDYGGDEGWMRETKVPFFLGTPSGAVREMYIGANGEDLIQTICSSCGQP